MKEGSIHVVRFLVLGLFLGAMPWSLGRAAASPVPQTGRIVDIQPREPSGQLKVSRRRNERPVDAAINMQVRRGDLLILAKGAKATIVCDGNKKKYQLTPNASQACPCSAPARVKTRWFDTIFNPRAGEDTAHSNFPVIISPRNTQVLNTRPKLRWSPVRTSTTAPSTSDTVYRVGIYTDNEKLVWTREREVINRTEMEYPSDEEALAPGLYMLVVQTGGRSSNDEHWPKRGFTVLPACALGSPKRAGVPWCFAQQVRREEKRIRAMNVPDDSTRLLLAKLYASNMLYAEAIEEMERVRETLRTPLVVSELGSFYASVGLNREAVNLYQEALSLPAMASDAEAQALTLYHLGLAYEMLGFWNQARAKYEEAIRAYKKLGDKRMVALLKKSLGP